MDLVDMNFKTFARTVTLLMPFNKYPINNVQPEEHILKETAVVEKLLSEEGLLPLYAQGDEGFFEVNQLKDLCAFVQKYPVYHIGVVMKLEGEFILVNSIAHRVNRTAYFIARGDTNESLCCSLNPRIVCPCTLTHVNTYERMNGGSITVYFNNLLDDAFLKVLGMGGKNIPEDAVFPISVSENSLAVHTATYPYATTIKIISTHLSVAGCLDVVGFVEIPWEQDGNPTSSAGVDTYLFQAHIDLMPYLQEYMR